MLKQRGPDCRMGPGYARPDRPAQAGARRATSLHVLILLVSQDLGRGLGIVEKLADLLDVLLLDAVLPIDLGKQVGWGQQLH